MKFPTTKQQCDYDYDYDYDQDIADSEAIRAFHNKSCVIAQQLAGWHFEQSQRLTKRIIALKKRQRLANLIIFCNTGAYPK